MHADEVYKIGWLFAGCLCGESCVDRTLVRQLSILEVGFL